MQALRIAAPGIHSTDASKLVESRPNTVVLTGLSSTHRIQMG